MSGKIMTAKCPNPTDVFVGKRLRMRRLMLDMSQTDIGDKLGVTFQQVQKYEKGTNRVSASRLQALSHHLGVPVAFFFDGAPRVPGDHSGNAPMPDFVSEFFASSDGLALTRAFMKVDDAKLRRRIVELVVAFAGE